MRCSALLVLAGCFTAPSPPAGPSRAWRLRANASQPGGLAGPRLAYDPDLQRVLLYGGATGDVISSAMYALDPTGWTPVCTGAPGPAPVHAPGFAYDRVHHRAVIVGGAADRMGTMPSAYAASCDLAAGTWTPLPAVQPARAFGHLVARDDGALVLFGGEGSGQTDLTDQRISSDGGASWTPLPDAPVTFGSQADAATWDADQQRILALRQSPSEGGYSSFDELWELRDTSWSQVCGPCSGLPKSDAGLVHLRGTAETYLISGYADGAPVLPTAVLDHDVWVKVADEPPLRDSMGVAYDEARGVVVIYGGNGYTCSSGALDCSDTWELIPR